MSPAAGARTIIEMVQQTRLDAATAPAGMMRQGLVQAFHHARQRRAFGKLLIDQPLMRNVLVDLALEWEVATHLVLHIARAVDDAHGDDQSALLARLAIAVTKYWTNKRASQFLYECLVPTADLDAIIGRIWAE